MNEIVVDVPGRWNYAVTCLDLETVKVPTPPNFRMDSGERLRQRWSIAMAGVACDGWISLIGGGDETSRLEALSNLLKMREEIRYGATRQFDEMICRGRFTNARRAHQALPTFPHVDGAEEMPWFNIGLIRAQFDGMPVRGWDCASKDVPQMIERGTAAEKQTVKVHLLRDVVELILTASPDRECSEWCVDVLFDYDFAEERVS
jgi:hypothetical protein